MKRDEARPVDVEVLQPEGRGVTVRAPAVVSTGYLLRQHLFTCPAIVPVARAYLTREDLEAPFPHRFGAAVVFAILSVEYALSPDGTLRAFGKLFMRWLLALLMVVVALGLPLVIAAHFIDQVFAAIESAMRHLFWASVWLLGSLCVLAALVAGLMVLCRRK